MSSHHAFSLKRPDAAWSSESLRGSSTAPCLSRFAGSVGLAQNDRGLRSRHSQSLSRRQAGSQLRLIVNGAHFVTNFEISFLTPWFLRTPILIDSILHLWAVACNGSTQPFSPHTMSATANRWIHGQGQRPKAKGQEPKSCFSH